ncbi:MAG: hypothetical protein EBT07_03830 [Actinobacteria bacterium]|nr:hypothetical protein [Actinomycetota bacterium]
MFANFRPGIRKVGLGAFLAFCAASFAFRFSFQVVSLGPRGPVKKLFVDGFGELGRKLGLLTENNKL